MMQIPTLQIIFYLALLFLPKGATHFTISSDSPEKITWVHQADGSWQAKDDQGKDKGVWITNASGVSISFQEQTAITDVSKFIKSDQADGQTNQVLLFDRPLMVSNSPTTLTFSQEKGGQLEKPLSISYGTN